MVAFGVPSLVNALSLPSSDDADEIALVARLATGDESALRDVYRNHHGALRSFARRLVGDDMSAEDLVQEVFVRLPKAARRFRGDASLRSFLIGIAVNHARHHVRSAVRRRSLADRQSRASSAQESRPDVEHERRSLGEALSRALDSLPLDERVAFVLCAVEERTSAEAAVLAGTRDSTIRSRLLKARQKLRVELAGWVTPKGEAR
jgi:RNA polymerase sigma-70 factor (ECF subfamily)